LNRGFDRRSIATVKTGAVALRINAEGKISRVTIVYDSRNLPAARRNKLAALTLEPVQ